MDKHYLVTRLLWSLSLNRYVVPGEVLVYSDEAAAPLLAVGVIVLIEQEIEDGTDDN